MDDRMTQLESDLQSYLTAYQRTTAPEEHENIYAQFQKTLDAAIAASDHEGTDAVIFNAVGHWLYRGLRFDELWLWIQRIARNASCSRRITLQISLLAGIPEDEPPEPNQILRLFDCLVDPELQWMIAAAYVECPSRLYAHLCYYLQLKGRIE